GVFSLTRQAILLDQLPPFTIVQTSHESYGQIYIPVINWVLTIATISLVVGFQSSNGLAEAYGVAVAPDMLISTILAFFVALRWGLCPAVAAVAAALLLVVDLVFFGAHQFMIAGGGWIPVLIVGCIFVFMGSWRRGRQLMQTPLREDLEPREAFLDIL